MIPSHQEHDTMKGTFIAIDEHGMKKNPDPLSIGAIRRKRTMSGDLVPNQKELEGPFALVIEPLYITPGK